MVIRAATASDLDGILAMQREIHAEHLALDAARWTVGHPVENAYRTWLSFLMSDEQAGLALVAERDSKLRGYLLAEVEEESTRHWSPRAVYLHDLFVDPASRRSGVAGKLMTRLLEWTQTYHPWLQVRLITAVQNESARAFFERLGFRSSAVEMLREPDRP
jgi:ribosomal protein S18 acetylase RimI-like enzyme